MGKRFKELKEMTWQEVKKPTHQELAMKIIRTSGIDLVHWYNALAQMIENEIKQS
jgi:hypothetical protein